MEFITVPPLTVLDVVGQDGARVLNNLCTAPLLQLNVGDGCETFITDVRGRTLGHVAVYRHDDRLRLIGAAGQADVIASHLDRYTIREDVRAEDRSADWSGLLVTEECLRRMDPGLQFGTPLTPQTLLWQPIGGTELIAYRVPWTGDRRVLAAGPRAAMESLSQSLGNLGAEAHGKSSFHAARVSHRFPWFGVDLDDRNLPQEADRDGLAISFTKGCYLGQETVARLDALGQVQKKLVLWRIDSLQPPAAGTELADDGRVVGRLTSVVDNPAGGGYLALGFARRSHFDAGAVASWQREDNEAVTAVVV